MKILRTHKKAEAGMTLLEVMIAGIVLMTGILVGVLPMITYGVTTMRYADEDTIAKQKARQIMESVYGARNTSELGWDAVNNTDQCTTHGTSLVCGSFLKGVQPMYGAGLDGIMGTADDGTIETYTMANGQTRTLNEFRRQITITPYGSSATLRQIEVDIYYPVDAAGDVTPLTKTFTIRSLISQYK